MEVSMSTLSSEKKSKSTSRDAKLKELTSRLEQLANSFRYWPVSIADSMPKAGNTSITFEEPKVSPLVVAVDYRLIKSLYYSPMGFEILGLEVFNDRNVALRVKDRRMPDAELYIGFDFYYQSVDLLGMLLYTNLFEDIVNERYKGSAELAELLKRIGMFAYYGAEQGIHEEVEGRGYLPYEASFLVSLPPSAYYRYAGLHFTTSFTELYYVTHNTPGSSGYEVAVAIHPPTRGPSMYSISLDEFVQTPFCRRVLEKFDEIRDELHKLSNSMKMAFVGLYTYSTFRGGR